ncbi:3-oxoacyl-[acyl-carrier-protein] synthase III C-terminal domain-containing protein [Desulfoscipio geothermicus]
MSSLDIVIALHEGIRSGRVRPGHMVVAAGAGTGYTWGANVFKWGKCE